MEFGSIVFLLRFLPIFLILYYLVPGRMKNVILLLGSLCFYAWGEPFYALIMLFSTCSDFVHALFIEKYRGKAAARILLSTALILDLGILILFGYADLILGTMNALAGTNCRLFGFPFPVGLTVYTLQTISYVVDVYRGRVVASRNILDYAAYVAMFPQLSAGPIVKYREVQGALRERKVDVHQISEGVKRICVGLGKKILIADGVGQLWTAIRGMNPAGMSVGTAWLGVLAFAFQIYFRYSGYADVAIGLGACMGFSFPENFDHPYVARSVTDFLRRWNITLAKWMKEYFYRAAMGERKGVLRSIFWIGITWALIGLWYGPDGTFLLWGIWMAFFYVLEKLFLERIQSVLPSLFNWCYAMLVVAVGWLLFALDDVKDVWIYLKAMFGQGTGGFVDNRCMFFVLEYLPALVLGVLFASPLISGALKRLQKSRSGVGIAWHRLLEKIYPAVLLLLSLLYLVGRGA